MEYTIAITADFAAEPIREPLEYWMRTLGMPAAVEIAPCDFVPRQLLDPNSPAGRNRAGFNVVLIRWQDWLHLEQIEGSARTAEQSDSTGFAMERAVREFAGRLRTARENPDVFWIVCVCPTSPGMKFESRHPGLFLRAEALLANELESFNHAALIGNRQAVETYPVDDFSDPRAETIARIPYTPCFYSVLGTLVARRIWRVKNPPAKVVVLDCDQTLWRGVCSEDGPARVSLDAARRRVQEIALKLRSEGALLCLCSKNEERDVREVFLRHPDWPLQFECFAGWRINWKRKSENLRSLARELRLGLESFIFIDDSAYECAEAREAAPEVLCLCLPADPRGIPHFLANVWPLDPPLWTTDADRNRTGHYKCEREREQFRRESTSFGEFLKNLGLDIRFYSMTPAHFPRASQLTQRTHQFNAAPHPRSPAEIARLVGMEGWEGIAVEPRDRFGEYGFVGFLLYRSRGNVLEVDTFLLSCRALGRNVERRMLVWLGELAKTRRCEEIRVSFVPTAKNQLARGFFSSIPGATNQAGRDESAFSFRTSAMLSDAGSAEDDWWSDAHMREEVGGGSGQEKNLVEAPAGRVRSTYGSELVMRIALEHDSAEAIHQRIQAAKAQGGRFSREAGERSPITQVEARLAEVWGKLLGVDAVGPRGNFFEMGGDSVSLVRLEAMIFTIYGVTVELAAWVESPELGALAVLVENQMLTGLQIEEADHLLRQVEEMPESDALAWLTSARRKAVGGAGRNGPATTEDE